MLARRHLHESLFSRHFERIRVPVDVETCSDDSDLAKRGQDVKRPHWVMGHIEEGFTTVEDDIAPVVVDECR